MRKLGARPAQRFLGDLPLGHILDRTNDDGPIGVMLDTMANGMQIFEHTARGNDPVRKIDVAAGGRSFEHRRKRRQVVRVDKLSDAVGRDGRCRIELENAAEFLGPEKLAPVEVPGEAAGLAEPLRLGKMDIGALQICFVRLSALLDIHSVLAVASKA
ncbi:hypothetical protein M3632_10505 [Sphingopyxis alaskensis]|nr:hypothetical protein [Sphingopyxis alaskensis]MCM3419788.1 hypothetical protein [Sphingopyxis alaskensis]